MRLFPLHFRSRPLFNPDGTLSTSDPRAKLAHPSLTGEAFIPVPPNVDPEYLELQEELLREFRQREFEKHFGKPSRNEDEAELSDTELRELISLGRPPLRPEDEDGELSPELLRVLISGGKHLKDGERFGREAEGGVEVDFSEPAVNPNRRGERKRRNSTPIPPPQDVSDEYKKLQRQLKEEYERRKRKKEKEEETKKTKKEDDGPRGAKQLRGFSGQSGGGESGGAAKVGSEDLERLREKLLQEYHTKRKQQKSQRAEAEAKEKSDDDLLATASSSDRDKVKSEKTGTLYVEDGKLNFEIALPNFSRLTGGNKHKYKESSHSHGHSHGHGGNDQRYRQQQQQHQQQQQYHQQQQQQQQQQNQKPAYYTTRPHSSSSSSSSSSHHHKPPYPPVYYGDPHDPHKPAGYPPHHYKHLYKHHHHHHKEEGEEGAEEHKQYHDYYHYTHPEADPEVPPNVSDEFLKMRQQLLSEYYYKQHKKIKEDDDDKEEDGDEEDEDEGEEEEDGDGEEGDEDDDAEREREEAQEAAAAAAAAVTGSDDDSGGRKFTRWRGGRTKSRHRPRKPSLKLSSRPRPISSSSSQGRLPRKELTREELGILLEDFLRSRGIATVDEMKKKQPEPGVVDSILDGLRRRIRQAYLSGGESALGEELFGSGAEGGSLSSLLSASRIVAPADGGAEPKPPPGAEPPPGVAQFASPYQVGGGGGGGLRSHRNRLTEGQYHSSGEGRGRPVTSEMAATVRQYCCFFRALDLCQLFAINFN